MKQPKNTCDYCNYPATHGKLCAVCEQRLDQFAGQALTGMVGDWGAPEAALTELCYGYAELMMQERKKRLYDSNKEVV